MFISSMKNPVLIFYSGADRVSFESLAVRVNDSFCSLPICLPVMFESLAVRVNDSFCSLLICLPVVQVAVPFHCARSVL
jgi:hypothetical protein